MVRGVCKLVVDWTVLLVVVDKPTVDEPTVDWTVDATVDWPVVFVDDVEASVEVVPAKQELSSELSTQFWSPSHLREDSMHL